MFYDGRIDYTRRGVVSMAGRKPIYDWDAIREEYISDERITCRALGRKYGPHYKSIENKSKKENWDELRSQITRNTISKTVERTSTERSERETALMEAADLLLERTINGISAYRGLPATAAKNYSDALKNIKEIHMIRTAEDIEEQQARIAKLKKEVQDDDKSKTITVTLEGDLSRYAK